MGAYIGRALAVFSELLRVSDAGTQGRHAHGLEHAAGKEAWERLVVADLTGPFKKSFAGAVRQIGLLDLTTGLGWAESIRSRSTDAILVGLGRCVAELRLDDPAVHWVLLFDRETAIYRDPRTHRGLLALGAGPPEAGHPKSSRSSR